ncbi:hypothetical protein ABOM_010660 [Aspergillus bombycis]|uniref:Nucleoside phosphorylase domain-containing protein n=1 Tax=Aspergillus bombycis TaxID=109264 RepID=A0A1F7ZMR1_9EURO|nr:hypothetical protein ABOM_010660 [Aspergillus bombycis]OGM40589.1 hypothetical protein ABOM_010660 [Aspergillus bombycis]
MVTKKPDYNAYTVGWDAVVSDLRGSHGGVLHYDAGKFKDNRVFHITSYLNQQPSLLLTATQRLRPDHEFDLRQMENYIRQVCSKLARLLAPRTYPIPGWERDQLFTSSYEHTSNGDCSRCDCAYPMKRIDRESDIPVVHYGLISSGSAIMRSAQRRDELRDEWDICCFEMEAAGLMDDFPCIVIRGICDYSDGHKNKEWQPYAVITAAVYAKDLLRVVHSQAVEEAVPVLEVLNDVSCTLD